MKSVIVFTLIILLLILVPFVPTITIWSMQACGIPIEVNVKTYFAMWWLLLLIPTSNSCSKKK